jgi:hypothetical protein
MKRTLACLVLFLLSACSVLAQTTPVPPLLNFQGRLAKPDGTPVPDGTYSFKFSLFTAATGGTLKWTETDTVKVHNGVFAVLLGKTTALTDSVFAGNVWLEIKAGSDPALTPRQQLVSAAYAMKANAVPDGSITSAKLAPDAKTAGGDLNGTYPDPRLATLASSLAKVSGGVMSSSGSSIGINGGVLDLFDIVGSSADGTWMNLQNTSAGGKRWALIATGSSNGEGAGNLSFKNNTDGNVPLLVRSDGHVGVNTTSPGANLEVDGSGIFVLSVVGSSADGTWMNLQNTSAGGIPWVLLSTGSNNGEGAGNLIFKNDSTGGVPMVIRGDGNVGINTTAPAYTLDVNGTIRGNNVSPSDARYKRNITTLYNALDAVLQLRGVSFTWRRDAFTCMNFPTGRQIGLIAQEVEKVLPELVTTDSDSYKSVAYTGVVPVLVEAIKQQQKQLEAVKAENARLNIRLKKVDTLQSQLSALSARLSQMEARQARR